MVEAKLWIVVPLQYNNVTFFYLQNHVYNPKKDIAKEIRKRGRNYTIRRVYSFGSASTADHSPYPLLGP
jgi:hypothetical protein